MTTGYTALSAEPELGDDHDGILTPTLPRTPSESSTGERSALLEASIDRQGLKRKHHYHDRTGRTGLAGLWSNAFAWRCAMFASLGGLTFGYDQGVIANVLVMQDFVLKFPVGAWEKGLMTAMLELGALCGALMAGTLADRYSRRHSIFLASIVFCLGSIIQCAAKSLSSLIVGRAIGGVGVGALSMLSPLYMAEISPPEVRGSLIALEQFSIVLGVVIGFWTGYATRNIPGTSSWRIPLGIQILPGLILGFGCLLLPASPRLLVLKGKFEEARRSLAALRNKSENDDLVQVELLEMRVETALVQSVVSVHATSQKDVGFIAYIKDGWKAWSVLFTSKYIRRTMVGIMVTFFQQWSAINALLYYGPTLVASVGAQEGISLVVSGGIGIAQLIAVIPAILVIDRLGRRPLLRGGSAIMTCSHLGIALLVFRYEGEWESNAWAAWTAISCMYIFTFAYGLSFGPVAWVLPSEVFPLTVRSRGVAISTASVWINNFLIGLLTPPMIAFSTSGTFGVFAVACFLAYFWATYALPEADTAGRSLEEMDELFGGDGKDVALKQQIEDEMGLTDLLIRLDLN